MAHIPEPPTESDLSSLIKAQAERNGDLESAVSEIEGAYIAKFSIYVPDGPGYVGPLFMIVWSGGPELFDVAIRKKGSFDLEFIEKPNASVS